MNERARSEIAQVRITLEELRAGRATKVEVIGFD
jgi:hypothetical protein